ncbi:MAG: hypothetical protein IJT59_00365 [Desulfovibrionaceae bacterium]|nr:hypothetical protein [Desulfovibrionaceae bacterium]
MPNDFENLDSFLDGWEIDPLNAKPAFTQYRQILSQDGVSLSFKARPGVSYSLRAQHINQTKRELFVLVDVVDDEPESRWLSVCFYADMVSDPKEVGDFVPQGLMNEDAICFNLDEDDSDQQAYIAERLQEALNNAAK